MTRQFELGSKHIENKKQAKLMLEQMDSSDIKKATKELIEKSYGVLPSNSSIYTDYLGLAVILEEIAKAAPEVASVLVEQVLVQKIADKYKAEKLLAQGEIYALLCAEPGVATFDGNFTKAVKLGDSWHLEGKKLIRKEQLIADKYLVFAKDEDDKVRIFLILSENIKLNQISKNIAGTTINIEQVEINFDISQEAELALVDEGYEEIIAIARTLVAAVSLGVGDSSIITGIQAVKETKGPSNQAISNTQSAQFILADMFSELEAGRMLTHYSANLIDQDKPSIKFATMAKVQSTDTASSLSMQALQLLGNIGYIASNDFANVLQAALSGQIHGGTNRVQRNQIYQYMLANKK